ncbi:MAG: tRNA wybutosine-synthesizing 3 family protein [Candidatus Woesearchaeota archaeon]
MSFKLQKRQALDRKDNSRRGEVDKEILHVVDAINRLDDFYTTSSCAGRVVLLAKDERARKCDSKMLFVTHKRISPLRVLKVLNCQEKQMVWLRQESFIIHVCAKTLDSANRLLLLAREAGFKHSGILTVGKRIILEIEGTERMDVPIFHKKLLVNKHYLNIVCRIANKKMQKNLKKIDAFYRLLTEKMLNTN